MNKIIFMVSLVLLVVSGCATKSVNTDTVKSNSSCMSSAPEWVVNNGLAGGVSGVGSSIINRAGLQYARLEALSLARDKIGETIIVKVNNTFKIFVGSTGIRSSEALQAMAKKVSDKVSSQMMGSSRQSDSWVSPCDELFILAVVDSTSTKSAVKDNMMTVFRDDNVLWSQFQANKMQFDLEAAIDREFRDGANK